MRLPDNNGTTTSTAQVNNSETGSRRPKRDAAEEGQAKRRKTAAYYRKLDAKLKDDMAGADQKYTKSGEIRCEYLGTNRR